MNEILRTSEEDEATRVAAEGVRDAIEMDGVGGAHVPLAVIADKLHAIRETMPAEAGAARADIARIVSLVGEAAEIAARYL